jgi:hypothetical protein
MARGLIFFDTKMNFLKEVLNKTSVGDESQLIYLDRLDAAKHLGKRISNRRECR